MKQVIKEVIVFLLIIMFASAVPTIGGCMLLMDKNKKVEQMQKQIDTMKDKNTAFKLSVVEFEKELEIFKQKRIWAKSVLNEIKIEYKKINDKVLSNEKNITNN